MYTVQEETNMNEYVYSTVHSHNVVDQTYEIYTNVEDLALHIYCILYSMYHIQLSKSGIGNKLNGKELLEIQRKEFFPSLF